MLYIKQINNIKEIFYDKYPKWLNYIFYVAKCIFCILTIKKANHCYIPYKKLNNILIIKLIVIMLKRQNKTIIFSNKLLENKKFMEEVTHYNIRVVNRRNLFDYNIIKILEYISNIKGKTLKELEITILINNISNKNIEMIEYLANNVKRLKVVTTQFNKLAKTEEYLQKELGIAILISNNKRKSLLNSEIIINIDFSENQLDTYQINRNAIIIQKEKIQILKKSFEGINVIDYNIEYEKEEFFMSFNSKDILASFININKSYFEVVNEIKLYNIRIVELIGNKDTINIHEFI